MPKSLKRPTEGDNRCPDLGELVGAQGGFVLHERIVRQTPDCCTAATPTRPYNKSHKRGAVTVAIGYIRVSTDQQGDRGYGLDAQTELIRDEMTRRGWVEGPIYVDVASGKSTRRRPEYAAAVRELSEGRAQVLVVAKLDRLSRSLLDFAALMAQSGREGWSINALDIGIDTSTINGELIANIIMALAQWERRIIGQRTKLALGQVRGHGKRLGRPTLVTSEAWAVIRAMRGEGASYRKVADALNAQGVPTAQGGRQWYASSVRAVEMSQQASPDSHPVAVV